MKKVISLFLAVLMLVSVVPMAASAATNTLDFKWQYYNGGTIFDGYEVYGITDFGKSETEYVIPEKYVGTKVVAIADDSFVNFTQIKSLSMSNNYLFSIGDRAFKGCTNLATATLSTKLTYLGESAFEGCSSLKSITIPSGVKVIKANTFKGCTALETVVLPSTVTTIESGAFSGCTSLKNITIPASLTTLGMGAFQDCASIENAAIPAGVTVIEANTFKGCTSLKTLTMANVKTIGSYAFYNCTSLKNVTFSSALTEIGDHAFSGCSAIEALSLPGNLQTIKAGAFSDCSAISSVTLPSSVKKIEHSVFEDCTALESVVIPDSVTELDSSVFSGCSSLKNVNLPKNIKTIGSYLFSQCHLETLKIYEGVTEIEYNAFYLGTVDEIYLPSTLTEVKKPRELYASKTVNFAGSPEAFEALGLEFNEDVTINYRVCTATGEEHVIDSKTVVSVTPTCSKEGEKYNKCKNCAYRLVQTIDIDPDNHVYGRWTTVKESTCTAKGQERYTCTCGNYDVYRDIPMKPHYLSYKTVEATCTTEKVSVKSCTSCEYEEKTVISPALGHKDDNHDGICDRCNEDATKNCNHLCHKGGFLHKFCLFFWKLFKIQKECSCGMYHY